MCGGRNVEDRFSWAFAHVGLILIVIDGIYGRNLLDCLVGGICRGAFKVILTSLIFLMKDQMKLIFVPL